MILSKVDHKEYWDKLVEVANEMELKPSVVADTMMIKCNDADLQIMIEMAKE